MPTKQTILSSIIRYKKRFVEERAKDTPLSLIKKRIACDTFSTLSSKRDFFSALKEKYDSKEPAVIAEVKKASPSRGIIRSDFNPVSIAMDYEFYGATCLSVLTDEKYFQGNDNYLSAIKKTTKLPIIRKDFIISSYQVYESYLLGADCILLIATCLPKNKIALYIEIANSLDIDVIVEIHSEDELEKIKDLPVKIVGINNRDLRTFEVDFENSIRIKSLIPDDIIVVAESGIKDKEDIRRLQEENINTFLIGESFMREKSPGQALNKLIS